MGSTVLWPLLSPPERQLPSRDWSAPLPVPSKRYPSLPADSLPPFLNLQIICPPLPL